MSLGRVMGIAVLGLASLVGPRLLFKSAGVDPKAMVSMIETIRSQQSGENLEADIERQLEALQNGNVESVNLEQLAAVQDITRESEAIQKKVQAAESLIKAFKEPKPLGEDMRAGILRDSEKGRRFYRKNRSKIIAVLAALVVGTVVMGALGLMDIARGVARLWLTVSYAFSGIYLIMASTATVAYFIASKLNPWSLLPSEVVAGPALLMIVSGMLLRCIDPEYPVWNHALRSLGAPIAACLIIAGLGLR